MGERVLVTGAQGLLGRSVVAALLSAVPCPTVVGVGAVQRLDDVFTHDLAWCGERVLAPLPTALQWIASHPSYDYRRVDLRDRVAVTECSATCNPTSSSTRRRAAGRTVAEPCRLES